jgi:hypothetical protein
LYRGGFDELLSWLSSEALTKVLSLQQF